MTSDRFNNLNSALRLETGFIILPERLILNENFTFMAWIKIVKLKNSNTIFFCENNNNYVINLRFVNQTNAFIFSIFNYNFKNSMNMYNYLNKTDTSEFLNITEWFHITVSLKRSIANIYLNGVKTEEKNNMRILKNAENCIIGKRSIKAKSLYNSDMIIDDIKIFNRSLKETEVKEIIKFYH